MNCEQSYMQERWSELYANVSLDKVFELLESKPCFVKIKHIFINHKIDANIFEELTLQMQFCTTQAVRTVFFQNMI